MTPPAGDRVRDRRVVLLLAACVAAVLGADILSGLVPDLDRLVSRGPLLVVVLVAGTVAVLVLSARRARRRGDRPGER